MSFIYMTSFKDKEVFDNTTMLQGLLLVFFLATAAFGGNSASSQELPECVYEAFPDLNKTLHSLMPVEEESKWSSQGLPCTLCVALLTEIEHILQDQTIEDAVSHDYSI